MQKSVISFLFLILGFLPSLSVSAGKQIIRYDDFVHMDFQQQVKTIQLVHEYLIEFEHLVLIKEARVQQKKRYHTYIKIMNFFMNSAYAARLDKHGTSLCYYGGWISLERNGRCAHPDRINWGVFNKDIKKMDPELQKYLQTLGKKYKAAKSTTSRRLKFNKNTKKFELSSGKSSCFKDRQIVCNPEIYGTDKGAPFCVSGNSNFGFNTSFLCNQALGAVKERENDGEEQYNKIMQNIVNNGVKGGNNNHFLYTLRAMYDTCLCGGANQENFSGSVSSSYAKRMYPSRTCYGILNQTQAIYNSSLSNKNACTTFSDTDFFDSRIAKWDQFLNRAHNQIKPELNKYKNLSSISFLNEDMGLEQAIEAQKKDVQGQFGKTRNSSSSSYVRAGLCPLKDFQPKKPQVVVTAEKVDGNKTKLTAKLTNTPPKPILGQWKVTPQTGKISMPEIPTQPVPQDSIEIIVDNAIDPEDVKFEIPVNEEKPEATARTFAKVDLPSLELDYNPETKKLIATVTNIKEEFKKDIVWKEAKVTEDAPSPVPERLEGEDKSIQPYAVNEHAKPYDITITAMAKNSDGKEITLVKNQKIEPAQKEIALTLSYDQESQIATAEIKDLPKEITEIKWDLAPEGKKAGEIKVSEGKTSDNPHIKYYDVARIEDLFTITANIKAGDKTAESNTVEVPPLAKKEDAKISCSLKVDKRIDKSGVSFIKEYTITTNGKIKKHTTLPSGFFLKTYNLSVAKKKVSLPSKKNSEKNTISDSDGEKKNNIDKNKKIAAEKTSKIQGLQGRHPEVSPSNLNVGVEYLLVLFNKDRSCEDSATIKYDLPKSKKKSPPRGINLPNLFNGLKKGADNSGYIKQGTQ